MAGVPCSRARRQVTVSEIGPGTGPTHCQTGRVAVEGGGVLGDPGGGGVGIVRGRGESVLWPMPYFDRNHDTGHNIGGGPAEKIHRFQVADHPTTPMKINQHRERFLAMGPVNADGNFATVGRE